MIIVQKATIIGKIGTYRSDLDLWIKINNVAQILVSDEDNGRGTNMMVTPDASDSLILLLEEFLTSDTSYPATLTEYTQELVKFLQEKGL